MLPTVGRGIGLSELQTGAVALDGPTVLVVSGGNVDPALAASVLAGDLA